MTAILDITAPKEAESSLKCMGYDVLRLPPCLALPDPVNTHPDMLLFFAPDKIFCTEGYAKIAQKELDIIAKVCEKPVQAIPQEYGADYPRDVLLNALPIKSKLFCNAKAVAPALLSHSAYQVQQVRQGYAKCNALPLGDHALITSDASIANAATRCALDVLQILPGSIRLSGYDHGFIGGCSSYAPYLKASEVLFCGALDAHPQAELITAFCRKHGFEAVSLGHFELTDVGTIFLI